MKSILVAPIIFFVSLNLAATPSEVISLDSLVRRFESYSLKKIAGDDFFMWEHKPRYWNTRMIFAGWMHHSPRSNHYAELIFDKNGMAQDMVQCQLDRQEQNFGSCWATTPEGELRLRWFWYEPPQFITPSPGEQVVFASIREIFALEGLPTGIVFR